MIIVTLLISNCKEIINQLLMKITDKVENF